MAMIDFVGGVPTLTLKVKYYWHYDVPVSIMVHSWSNSELLIFSVKLSVWYYEHDFCKGQTILAVKHGNSNQCLAIAKIRGEKKLPD